MTPYYDDGTCVIYHGDCREVLPAVANPIDVGLLLSDPPYGIDYKPLRGANGSKMWGTETVTGDAEPFDPAHLLRYRRVVLFGANHYADRLPPSGGWIVWDKTPRGIRDGFIYSHAELAWSNVIGRVEKFALEWQGASRQGEDFLHPTQKPIALMRWIIQRFSEEDDLVVDPYLGAGSTLVAAKEVGRRAIGIEIEERYCEIAAKRLSQETLGLEVPA